MESAESDHGSQRVQLARYKPSNDHVASESGGMISAQLAERIGLGSSRLDQLGPCWGLIIHLSGCEWLTWFITWGSRSVQPRLRASQSNAAYFASIICVKNDGASGIGFSRPPARPAQGFIAFASRLILLDAQTKLLGKEYLP